MSKEWYLELIFHFKIPRGNFSLYLTCFASEIINLAEKEFTKYGGID